MQRKAFFTLLFAFSFSGIWSIAQTYCVPANGCKNATIMQVTINGINRSSGCENSAMGNPAVLFSGNPVEGYSLHSLPNPVFELGASYPFTVVLGNTGTWSAPGPAGLNIWFDWNGNGSFSDPGELVFGAYNSAINNPTYTGTITVPVTATWGLTTRMRIRSAAYGRMDPCTDGRFNWSVGDWFDHGETEDYVVTIGVPPACSGPFEVGSTASSVAGLCQSEAATLSLPNLPLLTGLSYQWQRSTDGGSSWQSFGTNAVTQNVSQTGTTQYRCVVSCPAGTGRDTSTPVNILTYNSCECPNYCAPSGSVNCSARMLNITTSGGISNLNDAPNCGALVIRTGQSVSEYPGYGFQLSVTPSYVPTLSGALPNRYGVWVDWNNNRSFADPGETIVVTSSNANPFQASITVPAGVAPGSYRLRVGALFNSNTMPTACGSQAGNPHFADYCLEVVPIPPCNGTPDPGNTLSSSIWTTNGQFITLSVQRTHFGTGVSYQWQRSTDNGVSWNVLNIGTDSIASIQVVNNSTALYRSLVTCSASGQQAYSQPVTVYPGGNCANIPYAASLPNETNSIAITGFSLGSLRNSSACNALAPGPGSVAGRYSNYTGSFIPPAFTPGDTAAFTLNWNYCISGLGAGFKIFVDWNQNGSFLDASEEVYSAGLSHNTTVNASFVVPWWATAGYTRLRIVLFNDGTAPGPTGAYARGETEDYCLAVNSLPVCAPMNFPISISTQSPVVCSGQNFTLQISQPLLYRSLTYQWQRSSDGGNTWTNFGSGWVSQTTSQTSTQQYRLRVTCTASGEEAFSNVLTLNMGSSCFCGAYPASFASTSQGSDITLFAFGTMNNSSACNALANGTGSMAGRYSNYTNGTVQVPQVEPGESVPYRFQNSFCTNMIPTDIWTSYKIYADWNANGNFTDAGEELVVSMNNRHPISHAGSITVPAGTAPGIKRLRVVAADYDAPNIPTSFITSNNGRLANGETEDYCIEVVAAQPCASIPAPGKTLATSTTVCAGTTVTLTMEQSRAIQGMQFQWQQSSDGGNSWTNFGSGRIVQTATVNQPTSFRCVVSCSANTGNSISSEPVLVGVSSSCACAASCTPTSLSSSGCYESSITRIQSARGVRNVDFMKSCSNYSTYINAGSLYSMAQYPDSSLQLMIDTYYNDFSSPLFFKGWVDWNNDNDFDDPGETVLTGNMDYADGTTLIRSIAVPAGTTPGNKRIRLTLTFWAAPGNACDTYDLGETIDWCFEVLTPCVAKPQNADDSLTFSINAGQVQTLQQGCRLLAKIESTGSSPVTGAINAKLFVHDGQPVYRGRPYVRRSYEITPATNASSATARVTLYFLQSDFDSFNAHPNHGPDLPTDPDDTQGILNFCIFKYSGSSSDGSGLLDSYAKPGILLSVASGQVSLIWDANLQAWAASFTTTGFSGFFAGNNNPVLLPLADLLHFNGQRIAESNQLNWKLAPGHNFTRFDLERSIDGVRFQLLASIPASQQATSYEYIDGQSGASTHYYRLHLFEQGRSVGYSRQVLLQRDRRTRASLMVHPNPVGDILTARMETPNTGTATWRITNAYGSTVAAGTLQLQAGTHLMQQRVSQLPPGLYLLQVVLPQQESLPSVKFLKE